MRNFAKLDTTPPNSPLSPFSALCHPQTVKHYNENPLSCHPFPPKLLPTCENIGLQSRLHPIHAPRCTPPSPKSHVIPPGPHSSTAQKPRNINDPISNSETPSGELRAKLLSTCHGSTSRSPPRGLDTHTRTTGAAGVEGAGRARTSTRTPDRRPTRGLRGLAGLRDDAPGHTPATRRRRCGGRRRDRRARAGFEIDHSERSSRVAISRAAGPDGARNTSGATSNTGDLAGPQPQQAVPRAAAAQ